MRRVDSLKEEWKNETYNNINIQFYIYIYLRNKTLKRLQNVCDVYVKWKEYAKRA